MKKNKYIINLISFAIRCIIIFIIITIGSNHVFVKNKYYTSSNNQMIYAKIIISTDFKNTTSYKYSKKWLNKINISKTEPTIKNKDKLNIKDAYNNTIHIFHVVFAKYIISLLSIFINAFMLAKGLIISDWLIVKQSYSMFMFSFAAILLYPFIYTTYILLSLFQNCTPGYAIIWIMFAPIMVAIALIIQYTLLIPYKNNRAISYLKPKIINIFEYIKNSS